jgi:isoquinoline 1-oxidoreductase beta subunit
MDMVQFLHKIYDNNKNPDQQEKVERSRSVLDEVVKMADWGKELPAGHGSGIAVHHSFSSYAAMAAQVEVKGNDIIVHRVDCAVDCGLVLNPDIATAQMEGAVIMGMGIAFNPEISFRDGAVVNSNFHDYPLPRIGEAPTEINVSFVGQDYPSTGIGEPGVPTTAPALVNAIYAASGKRYRSFPIKRA